MRRDQRGVAMVTVLFVGMVLTVTITAASFITVRELQQGESDRRSTDAMALAEAGVDRFVNQIRQGTYSWNQIREAGCESAALAIPTGSLGRGIYNAQLQIYDPTAADPADRLPPTSCAARPASNEPHYVAITSTGVRQAGGTQVAQRIIRQVMKIEAMDSLPFGVFIDGRVDVNGNINMDRVSLLTTSDIFGRGKISFTGTDPYYTKRHLYGPTGSPSEFMPAAAHAMGHIYASTGGKATPEHPPSPNCSTNGSQGTTGQSLWDSSGDGGTVTSGCAGQTGMPPTAKFAGLYDLDGNGPNPPTAGLTEEHYSMLKTMAKASGIYCQFASGSNSASCTAYGAARTIDKTIDASDITPGTNFVFYIDMPSGTDPFSNAQTITWSAPHSPCSSVAGTNRSVVLVIRNGSLKYSANVSLTGAVLLPEGQIDSAGNFTHEGTIVAKQLRLRGGSTLKMSDCWVQNIPGYLLDVEPEHWAEVDR